MKAFSLLCCLMLGTGVAFAGATKPRVAVTTDINIRQGDPDDRQSLVHLFWYLDELDVRLIVADRSSGESRATGALSACHLALDAYTADYFSPGTQIRARGFPTPDQVEHRIKGGAADEGVQALIDEARRPDERPLWVLVWGNMQVLRDALRAAPDIAPKLRVISVGTFHNHLTGRPFAGANSAGRDEIFNDPRFTELWWIEDNNFEGMFAGLRHDHEDLADPFQRRPVGGPPYELLHQLLPYGAMGRHLLEATQGNEWAGYFRAGDTISVLYLLDPAHDINDPAQPSWAGEFERPWPSLRPHHWTDSARGELDYLHPAATQAKEAAVAEAKLARFLAGRPAFYAALVEKVKSLYPVPRE